MHDGSEDFPSPPGIEAQKHGGAARRASPLGAGWVVRNRHLPALKRIPEADVRLIWSRAPGRAHDAAVEFGIPKVATRWQDITTSPDVDAVVVATPPVLHCAVTLAALKAGKHVLCQARMARNLSEAREMLQAVRGLWPGDSSLSTPSRPQRGSRRETLDPSKVCCGEIQQVRVTGMRGTLSRHRCRVCASDSRGNAGFPRFGGGATLHGVLRSRRAFGKNGDGCLPSPRAGRHGIVGPVHRERLRHRFKYHQPQAQKSRRLLLFVTMGKDSEMELLLKRDRLGNTVAGSDERLLERTTMRGRHHCL